MEVLDRLSPAVFEDKTFDETTVFVSVNGSVSKKRRRKSSGRRVSFAEAPKLHIFPRDDEYETPTRGTNGASSPRREGGERRSPRLAARMADADKENRVLASNSAPQRGRRRGGSKPLAVRGNESPALKPHNWLDARGPPSQAGDIEEENTGPVDLRHLSFNQMETEMDEENMTLDSTTFALKSLQQIKIGELVAVVHLDRNRSAAVCPDDGEFRDKENVLDDVLVNDMSFTMPLLRRKPVRESTIGFETMSSDTCMSITMQVPRGQEKLCMVVGGDSIVVQVEDKSRAVSPHKAPPTGESMMPRSRDVNSVVSNSHDTQNGPAPVLEPQDVRALLLERFGDLSDTSPEQQNSEENKIPKAEDQRAQLEENFGNGDDEVNVHEENDSVCLSPLKIPPTTNFDLPDHRNVDSTAGISSQDAPNGPGSVARNHDIQDRLNSQLPEMELASVVDRRAPLEDDLGFNGDQPRLALQDVKISVAEVLRSELEERFGVDLSEDIDKTMGAENTTDMSVCSLTSMASIINEDRTITQGVPSLRQLIGQEEDERPLSIAHEDRTITMGIPSLRQLIRQDEDERPLSITYEDRTITLGVPSFRDLIRMEEEDEERMGEGGVVFDPKQRGTESLNLSEDAEMMLREEEFTGRDSGTTDMDESPGRNFAEDTVREALDRTVDAEMISTEEKFTGVDSRGTIRIESPALSFATHRARELQNPTVEAEMMLKEDEFTGPESQAVVIFEDSPIPNFDYRKTERKESESGRPSVDGEESDNGIISSCKSGSAALGKASRAPVPRFSRLLAADRKSLDSTPVRPTSRSMWMTPPSSVVSARAKDGCSPEVEDECNPDAKNVIHDTTALVSEITREDAEVSNSITKVLLEEDDAPNLTNKSSDTTAIIPERNQEDGDERISITRMSVEEFLQQTGVQFSFVSQSPREVLKDPSLAETYHVRSLSESFTFICLIKPQLDFMDDACRELYHAVFVKRTAVEEVEQRLTASNPAIFSYFQKAPELEKQQIREKLQKIQRSYRSAMKNRLQFQQRAEKEYNCNLLEMKTTMMYYAESTKEQRNILDENLHRRFPRLRASLSSRVAKEECMSTSQSKISAEKDLHTTVHLEMIKILTDRLEHLKSRGQFTLAKLTRKKQAAEETLRGLNQRADLAENSVSHLRRRVVDCVCSGNNRIQKEDVARNLYLHVQEMRSKVCLLQNLQDGFQVKSAGRENEDMIVELDYRSLVKRRYVVRKVDTTVTVLRSSWFLERVTIEETFPKMSAFEVFSYALRTSERSKASAVNSTGWTQMFSRLSASEAVRFTLPSDRAGDIPEPTDLRESMQVTRVLVGNLMELMEEIRNCQGVVSASCGGGILVECRFRDTSDGHLQLELKFIDYVSSIKFFLYLDMSCLPMNGYPLGDLAAKVEIAYCAPRLQTQFNQETLKHVLSLVRPGYQRLARTYAAVGSFIASIRGGVSSA